jgi:hypothetical protein
MLGKSQEMQAKRDYNSCYETRPVYTFDDTGLETFVRYHDRTDSAESHRRHDKSTFDPTSIPSTSGEIRRDGNSIGKSALVWQVAKSSRSRVDLIYSYRQLLAVLQQRGLQVPALFHSICVCDVRISGLPIKSHSAAFSLGPKGLTVGRCQFLNSPCTAAGTCALVPEMGADGKIRYLLDIGVPLVNPQEATEAFILISQVDMTDVVRGLAGSNLWCRESPNAASESSQWYHDMFHPTAHDSDRKYTAARRCSRPSMAEENSNQWAFSPCPCPEYSESTAGSRFAQLVGLLYWLHEDAFVLSSHEDTETHTRPSSTHALTFTSPSLVGVKQNLNANLSASPAGVVQQVNLGLQRRQLVKITVKWGSHGTPKVLYCIPLQSDHKATRQVNLWICFVVNTSFDNFRFG